MKMRNYIVAIGVLIGMASCQKEVSWEITDPNNPGGGGTGNPGGGSTGELLVKIVTKEGADSLVTTFSYDASKRLIREYIKGRTGGMAMDNETRIIRNGAGIITQIIQKNETFRQQGIDSVISQIFYDATTSRYTARVQSIAFAGIAVNDSTVFFYNPNGTLLRLETYNGSPSLGFDYELNTKFEYTYSPQGNITQYKTFSRDAISGTWDAIAEMNYSNFDNKVNPLPIPIAETAPLLRPDGVNSSNVGRVEFINLDSGLGSFVMTLTYTYNSQNKPATSQQTRQGIVSNSTYYYQ